MTRYIVKDDNAVMTVSKRLADELVRINGFQIIGTAPDDPNEISLDSVNEKIQELQSGVSYGKTTWLNATTPHFVSHRGVEVSAPENTIPAYDLSAQQGFAIGMDVYETIDKVFVCRHDNDLSTRSDATGTVLGSLYSSFYDASAGDWFSSNYKDTKIPTMEDVLNRYGGKHLLQIQIYSAQSDESYARIANLIAERKLENHVLFEVTTDAERQKLHVVNPNILVCLTGSQPANTSTISSKFFMVNWVESSITQTGVNEMKARGIKVQAYGVLTKTRADQLIALGVEFLNCSDPLFCKGGLTFAPPFTLPIGKGNFGSYWEFQSSTNAPEVNDYFAGYTREPAPSLYTKDFYGYTTKLNDLITFDIKYVDILPNNVHIDFLIVEDAINWNGQTGASSNKTMYTINIYADGKIIVYQMIGGTVYTRLSNTTAFSAFTNGDIKTFSIKLNASSIDLTTPTQTINVPLTAVFGNISLAFALGVKAGFKNIRVAQ